MADIEQQSNSENSNESTSPKSISDPISGQNRGDIVLEIMNEVFFELGERDIIQRLNKNAENYFKRSRKDLIGMNIWDIFPNSIGTPLFHLIKSAQEKRISIMQDIKSPMDKWAHASIAPLHDGLIVLLYDIHNEKEAEGKLLESEAQWRRLAMNTPDMVTRWDTDLKLIYGNQAFEERAGTPLAGMLGKNNLEIGQPEAIALPWMEKLKEVIATKKPVDHFYFYPMPHGTLYYYSRLVPECDEEQNVLSVLAIARDITELKVQDEHVKKMNESLLQKNAELEGKHKELTSLSYVASHDLKEPLRRIYTAIEWIVSNDVKNLSNGGKANFRRLQSAVQKMGLVTDDMLSFINISRSREEGHAIVDLNKVLEEAEKKISRLISEKDARIKSQELPFISGNETQLIELFKNILHNAIKFQLKDNIPEVEIYSSFVNADNTFPELSSGNNYLKISFKDNGIGFSPEHGQDLFNLFTKLNSPEKFRGMGVGLAICKKIISQHNGFIQASSLEGNGSIFECFFPV